MFCSEHAHYSVARAVAQLGIGANNVVTRAVRRPARDRPGGARAAARDRAAARRRGGRDRADRRPSARSTTSTRSGSICATRDIWLHVDGAHGGSALLSPTHRHRMDGVERVRSLAWDPHKMMLDAAGRERAADGRRGRPRRGLRAERAVPLPRSRRAARRPGRALVPVLAPRRRAEGLDRVAALRHGGVRGGLRPPLRDHPRDLGARRRAPVVRGRCTSRSATSSASGTSATTI